jgi:hypothetical protein
MFLHHIMIFLILKMDAVGCYEDYTAQQTKSY